MNDRKADIEAKRRALEAKQEKMFNDENRPDDGVDSTNTKALEKLQKYVLATVDHVQKDNAEPKINRSRKKSSLIFSNHFDVKEASVIEPAKSSNIMHIENVALQLNPNIAAEVGFFHRFGIRLMEILRTMFSFM